MLAVAAILGAATLAGNVQTPSIHGTDEERREYANAMGTSDDPMLFLNGQLNPRQFRMLGTANVRQPLGEIHKADRNYKAGQTEIADSIARTAALEPEDYEALSYWQWQGYNPDLLFTGSNNSVHNYKMRWARSLPTDMDPGLATLHHYDATINMSGLSTDVQNDSLMGPQHEDMFLYQQGGCEFRTGRRHKLDGEPWFIHLEYK